MGKKRSFKISKALFPFSLHTGVFEKAKSICYPPIYHQNKPDINCIPLLQAEVICAFLIEFAALIFIDIPCGLNNIRKAKVKAQSFQRNKGKNLQDIW